MCMQTSACRVQNWLKCCSGFTRQKRVENILSRIHAHLSRAIKYSVYLFVGDIKKLKRYCNEFC
jgi:hypothetical protein